MAERKKSVDAVIIGYGWTGAILAKTLTDAGLSVVALERGQPGLWLAFGLSSRLIRLLAGVFGKRCRGFRLCDARNGSTA